SRNVGYLHFEDLIGPRMWVHDIDNVRIVGVDSSEPDLNEGQVGRVHYDWISDQFAGPAALKVFVLHHHLMPIPGTGRERSIVMDAGDLLEVLVHAGVHVVLSGHKHVPYVWRLEDLYIANAGTVSSLRLRGYGKPCYNVLDFDGDEVVVALVVGGIEKLLPGDLPDVGVPVRSVAADRAEGLRAAIAEWRPDVVLDLSDEPVLGYRERMELVSVSLVLGVPYQGAD